VFTDCYFLFIGSFVQNELAILEFIHCVVETMDRYFGNVVCTSWLLVELDVRESSYKQNLSVLLGSSHDAI